MGEEHIIPLFGDYDEAAWGTALGIQVRRPEAEADEEPETDSEAELEVEAIEQSEAELEVEATEQSEESDSTTIEPPLIQEFFPLVKN
jgi:hypothetical protein